LVQYYENLTLESEENKLIEEKIIKIENAINQNNNEPQISYFKYFKLACFYMAHSKKNIKIELGKEAKDFSSQIIKKSLKKANTYKTKAEKLFLKDGQFSYPFQPEFSFSNKYKIFSISTFITYKASQDSDRIKSLENQISRLEHEIKIEEIKKKAEEGFSKALSNEQKQNTKRIVEVLAIFSAIVLFSTGSIQIYSSIETLQQAVVFTLFFGASLSFFAFLIYLIVRIQKERSILIIFTVICLSTIACGWYLLFEKEDVLFHQGKNEKAEISFKQNNYNLLSNTKNKVLEKEEK
jgi:cation transport ATPase